MAERNVTFKLGVDVDPSAQRKVRGLQSDLLKTKKELEASATGATGSNEHLAKALRGERDFNLERERVAKAAHRALLTFAQKYREDILNDARILMRESIRIAKEAAAQIKAIEDEKANHAIRVQKKIQAYIAMGRAREGARLNLSSYLLSENGSPVESTSGRSGPYGAGVVGPSANKRAEAGRQLREQFSEIGESVMRVSRGLLLMGLVGEKSMDKVRDGIMQAQAAFDLFGGSLKIINKLERAWAAYTVMVYGATAATNAHTASVLGSMAASASSVVGAVTGSAARNAAAAAAAGGGLGLASYGVGAGAGAAAGTGTAAATGGAAAATPFAAGAGAVGGALAGVAGIVGSARNAYNYGLAGGAKKDSYTDIVGRSDYNPFSWMIAADVKMSRRASDKATKGAENKSQMFQANMERNDTAVRNSLEEQSAIESKLMSLRAASASIQLNAARGSYDLIGKTAAIEGKTFMLRQQLAKTNSADTKVALETQIAALSTVQAQANAAKQISDEMARHDVLTTNMMKSQSRLAQLRAEYSKTFEHETDLRAKLREASDAEQQKLLDTAQQRLQLEQNVASIRAQSARVALQASQQELDNTNNRIKSQQMALLSAQERFGMMDPKEQKAAMTALAKGRTGRQLTREEITQLKGLGTTEAERLASFNARRLANSAYTEENQQLAEIERQRQSLNEREMDYRQGRINRRGERTVSNSFTKTRPFREGWSNRDLKAFDDIESSREQLFRQEQAIRARMAQDQAMRRSVFREEAGSLSRSMAQRQAIEARINTQLNVVVKFEQSAEQVATMAAQKMMEAYQPFVREVESRLNVITKQQRSLIDNRRRMVPGLGGGG